jgi:flagellar biosynthesis protein FliP
MCSRMLLLCYMMISATDQYLNNPSSQMVDIVCALILCFYVKWSIIQQINTWTIQVVRSLIYYVLLNVVAVSYDYLCNRSTFEQSKPSDRWSAMCFWTLLLCYLINNATDQYLNNPSSQIVDVLCALFLCLYFNWSVIQQINTWTVQAVG